MAKWLRGRSIFQLIALAVMSVAVGTAIVSYLLDGTGSSGFLTLAFILGYIAFRKELLWRVRSRLLITYFLFGVVPLFVIGLMLMVTTESLLGQFATQNVRQALEVRVESVRSTAQSLALAASHGAKADLLDGLRQQAPKLEAAVSTHGVIARLPSGSRFDGAPDWIGPGFAGIFEVDGRYYIGARSRDGMTDAFAYVPLDEQGLASLTPGIVSVAAILHGEDRTDFSFGPSGSKIATVEHRVRTQIFASGLKPSRGWWDVPIAGMLSWKVQSSAGETEIQVPLSSRPSLLVGGVATDQMAPVVFSLLIAVSLLFLSVEAISLFSSWAITRAITRSVDDLYGGTLRVAEGDFSHQISVRGQHQLSALATSFNGMISKISQLIGEVKKKEKLEAELEIARQVQLRLFPATVPKLKTLAMAGVCLPGRVVSGDYYDFVRLDNRWTAIALGDVSGKGVSAALLMASIQSALHAQLKFSAMLPDHVVSTAALMESISQQLYENTPPEKYATFFCSMYDDESGRLTYTNAGHLKPILIRDGKASALEGDGMVAGLLPNVKYEQQDILLRTGDLLAVFSDGIPEAEDASEQEFGEGRLADLLVSQAGEPLEDILKAVTGAVGKWTYDPEGRDDLTLVLLRKL